MNKQEAIAKRCIQWMNDVIDIKNELYEPNDEMDQFDLDAIEDARYIIECIEKQIENDDCDYHFKLATLVNKDGRRRKALYDSDRMLCSTDVMTIEFLASRGWKIESGDNE